MKEIYMILFIIKLKRKKRKVRFSDEIEVHWFQRDTFIIRYTESVLLFQFKKQFNIEDIIIKVHIPMEWTDPLLFYTHNPNGRKEDLSVFSYQDRSYELTYFQIHIQDEYIYLVVHRNELEYWIKIDYQELFEEYEDRIQINDLSGIHIEVQIF